MSLPEEEDRAVISAIQFFKELAGVDKSCKLERVSTEIRKNAFKHWSVLNVYIRANEFTDRERQMAVDEARKFLLSLIWPDAAPNISRDLRQRAHRVSKHFPILARKKD